MSQSVVPERFVKSMLGTTYIRRDLHLELTQTNDENLIPVSRKVKYSLSRPIVWTALHNVLSGHEPRPRRIRPKTN